jgi:probable HAF family extracellular repeat protein
MSLQWYAERMVQRRTRVVLTALLVAASPLSARGAAAAPAPAAAGYVVVDLGAPPGGTSGANGISDTGFVAGVQWDGVSQHAVRWGPGRRVADLGTLPGGGNSSAAAVNDAGMVTGLSDRSPGGFGYPVRWSAAGAIQDLGGPIANRLGTGAAIDPLGRVAGGQRPADSEGDPVGILYGLRGTPVELGAGLGLARGINRRDEVVGGPPAYRWHAGTATLLPALPGRPADAPGTVATAINVRGQIVGSAATAGGAGTDAVLWQGTSVTDLGTVGGIALNRATAINAAGQVVGTADPQCYPCPPARAWVRQPGGPLAELDGLVPAGSGWQLQAANGIDAGGRIVGTGLHDGVQHAFLLIPRR